MVILMTEYYYLSYSRRSTFGSTAASAQYVERSETLSGGSIFRQHKRLSRHYYQPTQLYSTHVQP